MGTCGRGYTTLMNIASENLKLSKDGIKGYHKTERQSRYMPW